jgi:hypothetical protein
MVQQQMPKSFPSLGTTKLDLALPEVHIMFPGAAITALRVVLGQGVKRDGSGVINVRDWPFRGVERGSARLGEVMIILVVGVMLFQLMGIQESVS